MSVRRAYDIVRGYNKRVVILGRHGCGPSRGHLELAERLIVATWEKAGAIGVDVTVWNDDGETLFAPNWWSIIYTPVFGSHGHDFRRVAIALCRERFAPKQTIVCAAEFRAVDIVS
jgi:hypothetical protein